MKNVGAVVPLSECLILRVPDAKMRVRKPEIPEVQVKNGKYEYHYQSVSSLQAPTSHAASRKPGKHLEAPDTVVNQPVLVECAG